MEESTSIINHLKENGFKITKGRKTIIEILLRQNAPITALKLLKLLHEQDLLLNKTTVYRELDFLADRHFVKELQFGERNKRYEIKSKHHHHVICKKCKHIEKISFDTLEDKLVLLEQKILQMGQYKGVRHSLEFFGLCKMCQL